MTEMFRYDINEKDPVSAGSLKHRLNAMMNTFVTFHHSETSLNLQGVRLCQIMNHTKKSIKAIGYPLN